MAELLYLALSLNVAVSLSVEILNYSIHSSEGWAARIRGMNRACLALESLPARLQAPSIRLSLDHQTDPPLALQPASDSYRYNLFHWATLQSPYSGLHYNLPTVGFTTISLLWAELQSPYCGLHYNLPTVGFTTIS